MCAQAQKHNETHYCNLEMREVQRERWRPSETMNHVHVHTTMQQQLLKRPAAFVHAPPPAEQSVHSSAFGRWYLGFWLTYLHAQVQLSQPQAQSPSLKAESIAGKGLCRVCRPHPHGKDQEGDRETFEPDSEPLRSADTQGGCFLRPCFPLLPCFGNKGSPGLLQPDS